MNDAFEPDAARKPRVGVVMGSRSDWETMRHACETLQSLRIAHEARVLSAHRTPDEMFAYAEAARSLGLEAIIAGAGGAAHLPGMLAAKTDVPVLGVPIGSTALNGQDSLYRSGSPGANTPKNFAGVEGNVDAYPPNPVPSVAGWGIVLLVGALLLAASGILRRRPVAA